MPPAPSADEAQYSDGTAIPTAVLDATTVEASRGTSPQTGAKTSEGTEPVPTITSFSPSTTPAAGGATITVTGTHLGGTTAFTVGGTSAAATVISETSATFVAPAKSAGAQAVVAVNAAGNSTGTHNLTYT